MQPGNIAAAVAIVACSNLLAAAANERLWARARCCASAGSALLISNRGRDVPRAARAQTWFAWDLVDASDLVTGPAGTAGLLALRCLELVLFVATIVYGSIADGPAAAPGGSFFLFFTNWTFVLFGATACLGIALTSQELRRQRRPTIPCIAPPTARSASAAAAHGWTWPLRAYHLALQTATAASVMLTIFYWVADYAPGTALRADNPLKHGASAAVLLADVGLSHMPVVSYHYQVTLAYGTAYLALLWGWWGSKGRWLYRALDWSKPAALAFYAGLPLLLLTGHAAMFLVAGVREAAQTCACFPRGIGCCACCCPGPRAKPLRVGMGRGHQGSSGAVVVEASPASPLAPPSPRLAVATRS